LADHLIYFSIHQTDAKTINNYTWKAPRLGRSDARGLSTADGTVLKLEGAVCVEGNRRLTHADSGELAVS